VSWTVALRTNVSSGIFYLAVAVALAQVFWHFALIRERSREGCFRAFRLNHWLGFTVFAGVAFSYIAK
jgi:4-hydroxybenzoate polyprenyltransferase